MHDHYGILLVLGISSFVAIIGAWIFQRLNVPQVVGYIVIGLAAGQTGFGLIDSAHLDSLRPFTFFALGMIGFLVGGELKISEFKKYGRQFSAILLGEGLAAFLLVGVGTGLLLYGICHDFRAALAGGIVFGAIASATDPASTIDVLWEYRSKGVLTTAIIAVVALDDALAMTLYSVGKSVATMLAGGSASVLDELGKVAFELGGAITLAAILAVVLNFMLRRVHDKERMLAISVCTLFLLVGLAVTFNLDVILAAMTLGFGVANLAPKRSADLFRMARGMSIPIYVLFFVLVGARLDISSMPGWVWGMAAIYVVGRSLGKMGGTWLGARFSKADDNVRKYCGLALFAQGGVAVGLSIVAGKNLQGVSLGSGLNLGDTIIVVITTTTLIVQLIGPAMTKLSIKYAGEAGRDIVEEDILANLKVSDVMTTENILISEQTTVHAAIDDFALKGGDIRAVTNRENRLVGMLSFDDLRDILPEHDSWEWLVVTDLMRDTEEPMGADQPLADAMAALRDTGRDETIVHEAGNPGVLAGILELSSARENIRQRLVAAARVV